MTAHKFTGPGSMAAALGARAQAPQPPPVHPVMAALTGLIDRPPDPSAQLTDHAARLDAHDAMLADHASQLADLAGDDEPDWDDASDHADQIALPNNPGYVE